jgi:hypothetical protein
MGYWINAFLRSGLLIPLSHLKAWHSWLERQQQANDEDFNKDFNPEYTDLADLGFDEYDSPDFFWEIRTIIETFTEYKIDMPYNSLFSNHYDGASMTIDDTYLRIFLTHKGAVSVDAGNPSSKNFSWNITKLPFTELQKLTLTTQEQTFLITIAKALIIPKYQPKAETYLGIINQLTNA